MEHSFLSLLFRFVTFWTRCGQILRDLKILLALGKSLKFTNVTLAMLKWFFWQIWFHLACTFHPDLHRRGQQILREEKKTMGWQPVTGKEFHHEHILNPLPTCRFNFFTYFNSQKYFLDKVWTDSSGLIRCFEREIEVENGSTWLEVVLFG